jgi:hypothetical protein
MIRRAGGLLAHHRRRGQDLLLLGQLGPFQQVDHLHLAVVQLAGTDPPKVGDGPLGPRRLVGDVQRQPNRAHGVLPAKG